MVVRQRLNATIEFEAKFSKAKHGWREYIEGRLQWPKGYTLSFNRTSAVAVVNFIVDAEGMVKDAYMTAPLHPEFDKIVLDMIYASPKWKYPGIFQNRRVQTWHSQSVNFVPQ